MARRTLDPPCPNAADHTPSPEGYLQWHEWAEEKSKTHRQIKCEGCDRYHIWVPKKSRVAPPRIQREGERHAGDQ